MMNKKWAVKRLTVNLTSSEAQKLEDYCAHTGRPSTDVIRELVRSLPVDEEKVAEIADSSELAGLGSSQKSKN
ncbi:CopG family transcriptional regulator [Komarekiella sp. 'clone 1']|uniref:CopG family transcriptional regulator n=1 Tax=Komarekiella delphini-convector SJRDD-AB1 TaxID=2593771 RepID=A0AA40T4S9_9NOST|nr:CopG family transcriptional regulator [Komarekiella delphini-convector]MBD6620936.1 CopG family transcriptional regulator [Komarekiella delphini-convector SJRDD-AB1]